MIQRTIVAVCVALGALALLGPLGCQSFVEAESPRDESQPGFAEGQRDLDDELCWQEVGSQPGDTSQSVQDLHDECMRAKGWTVAD
ncbi:MAG: hypothetical protein ACQGVK_13125 [Myxococcota bacterium]